MKLNIILDLVHAAHDVILKPIYSPILSTIQSPWIYNSVMFTYNCASVLTLCTIMQCAENISLFSTQAVFIGRGVNMGLWMFVYTNGYASNLFQKLSGPYQSTILFCSSLSVLSSTIHARKVLLHDPLYHKNKHTNTKLCIVSLILPIAVVSSFSKSR